MNRIRSCVAAVLVGLSCVATAQTILHTDAIAFSGATSHNVVRDGAGILYAVSIQSVSGTAALIVQLSPDGGQTWVTSPITLNDASSGLSGSATTLTNNCAVAIDDQGTLHVIWSSYYYPTYYAQFYRNFNPTSLALSPIVNLGGVTGAGTAVSAAANDIVVDQSNIVWLAAKGTSAWQEALVRSTAPYAAGNTFTSVGPISPSASAQVTRLAVDVVGNIHCGFYRNIGAGNYEHRIYTPGSGWAASTTVLGNLTPTNDFYGNLVADYLGNVHALIVEDAYSTTTWLFRYRRWDPTNGWSPETVVFDATPAQYTGVANYYVVALGCDEVTGKVTVVYRDLSTNGALRIAEKGLSDAAFTTVSDLTTPSTAVHEYYMPTVRGSLFPISNNTGSDLDITWQHRPPGATIFELWFQRVASAPPDSITLAAPAAIGTTTAVNIHAAFYVSTSYICGFAAGTTPGITLPDARVVPLNLDDLLTFSLTPGNGIFGNTLGTLDPAGDATITVAIPYAPAIVGYTIYGAFVIPDAGNPFGIGAISTALPITFQ